MRPGPLPSAARPRRMAAPEVARAARAAGPPAAGLLTASGELEACTADWADATGIPPGRRLVDAVRPDDLPALLGALGRTDRRLRLAVRAGRGDAAVEAILCLDGAWADGLWHVTARRAYRHRRSASAPGDALWVTALADGRVVHANPAWERLAGDPAERASGWAGWAQGGDRARVEAEFADWLADGAPGRLRVAFAVRDADRDERLVVAEGVAVLDAGGEIAFVRGTAMDLTDLAGLEPPAGVDPLTGLLDRRALERALEDVLDRCRQGDAGALVLIDLDGFKAVNDAHGHGIGDELLASVGGGLRQAVRDGDVAARLGGDEFAVVLRRSTPTEARAAAERLLSAVRRARPVSIDAPTGIDGSAGLASIEPGEALTVAEALHRADLALYDAKAAGRGATVVYPARDREAELRLRERRSTGQRLYRALRGDALDLVARPVIDLHDGSLAAWDLTPRMDGAAPDSRLADDARRAGLVAHLDQWQLRRLVEEAALDAQTPLTVVVDCSALDDPGLATRLETDMVRAGADAHRLVVGVACPSGSSPTRGAVETARALRRLGVELLLDGFGASPGSLVLLRALPVSVIRIAGEVACARTANAFDDSLVGYATDLAREFGLGVVADGIASRADLERARSLGVQAGLGPHLGGPVPLDTALARTPRSPQEEHHDECA